jgi:hypothetical protein
MSEAARKDVFSCEEFTLYPDGRLDSAPEVERALWRATLNINDRGDSEARLDLALALLQLAEQAAGHRSSTPEDLLARLSDTLGKMLIPALSVGPRLERKPDGLTQYDSPRSRLDTSKLEAESAAASAKNAITAIKSAMLAIARWKNHRPEPGSNHPASWVWVMQLTAKEIFRETLERPTKGEIRVRMETEGWHIKSKDANARWCERFRIAGLGNLPD